jgi:hypothetical protein
MKKNTAQKHFLYYFFLLFLLASGIFLAVQAKYDRGLQITVLLSMALAYILWGVLHHLLHHDLTAKIVIEYVLVGLLGALTVLLMLRGGL